MDLIDRQAAIDEVQAIGRLATLPDNDAVIRMSAVEYVLFNLPSAQPDLQPTCNQLATDCISRKWLMECVEEGWIKFDTEKDKNKFIHLVRDTAPSAQPCCKTDHVYMWLCPECGQVVHSDYTRCVKCGHERREQ